jgi:hypothetical protein
MTTRTETEESSEAVGRSDSHADGSENTVRPTSLTCPNGRVVTYSYSGTANDRASRVDSIQDGAQTLAEYGVPTPGCGASGPGAAPSSSACSPGSRRSRRSAPSSLGGTGALIVLATLVGDLRSAPWHGRETVPQRARPLLWACHPFRREKHTLRLTWTRFRRQCDGERTARDSEESVPGKHWMTILLGLVSGNM